jgi:NADH-quinone oxidoreductase subunit C
MPEDTKGNSSAPDTLASDATRPSPAAPTGPPAPTVQPAVQEPAKEPAAAPAAPQPAAAVPAAKPPAAPAKPPVPAPEPWNAPLPNDLRNRFGSALREASTYVGQHYLVVDSAEIPAVLQILRDQYQFDYCVDLTAVHYPKREAAPFDVIWILYSFARNERLRVKIQIKDGDAVPSSVALWPTANWLERECYDMFGISFAGHPDLRRILLPDGWKGFPLRKDYPITQQDTEWVRENLHIESGQ